MARFDVYSNPDAAERKRVPFLLDIQNDHIQNLQTRVVVPLWDSALVQTPMSDLNPVFKVGGRQVVMDTPALGAVPLAALRTTAGSLAAHQLIIQNAIDSLFGSY